ncbi:lipase secretion chaperone [Paludibacterium paludis]|uniref:Lipase helper protein n=1 Tax=Paludibacterium paludis TaxID=1225769 RepID=A0A918P0S0_9NEIS|nr:lipase secretion chaperone [Paludibacterium paludis]GGY11981.1 hypothetical protein GCM10011289_13720 [Paludibacterium paludis]
MTFAGRFAVAVLALAVAAMIFWPGRDDPPPRSESTGVALSQQGTQPDGAAREAHGRPVADAALRRLFDYHLAALGEKSAAAIRQSLAAALPAGLDARARGAVLDLFDRYRAYKQAVAARTPGAEESMKARLDAMRALRGRFFREEEARGLFGDSDRFDDFSLGLLAIRADPSLSAQEKTRRAGELEAALPAAMQEARREAVAHTALADQEAALLSQGGGDDDLYRLRSRVAGQAAAGRLAEMDRRQTDWQNRIAAYRAERERLAGNARLSPAERETALADYALAHFDSHERRRLAAY